MTSPKLRGTEIENELNEISDSDGSNSDSDIVGGFKNKVARKLENIMGRKEAKTDVVLNEQVTKNSPLKSRYNLASEHQSTERNSRKRKNADIDESDIKPSKMSSIGTSRSKNTIFQDEKDIIPETTSTCTRVSSPMHRNNVGIQKVLGIVNNAFSLNSPKNDVAKKIGVSPEKSAKVPIVCLNKISLPNEKNNWKSFFKSHAQSPIKSSGNRNSPSQQKTHKLVPDENCSEKFRVIPLSPSKTKENNYYEIEKQRNNSTPQKTIVKSDQNHSNEVLLKTYCRTPRVKKAILNDSEKSTYVESFSSNDSLNLNCILEKETYNLRSPSKQELCTMMSTSKINSAYSTPKKKVLDFNECKMLDNNSQSPSKTCFQKTVHETVKDNLQIDVGFEEKTDSSDVSSISSSLALKVRKKTSIIESSEDEEKPGDKHTTVEQKEGHTRKEPRLSNSEMKRLQIDMNMCVTPRRKNPSIVDKRSSLSLRQNRSSTSSLNSKHSEESQNEYKKMTRRKISSSKLYDENHDISKNKRGRSSIVLTKSEMKTKTPNLYLTTSKRDGDSDSDTDNEPILLGKSNGILNQTPAEDRSGELADEMLTPKKQMTSPRSKSITTPHSKCSAMINQTQNMLSPLQRKTVTVTTPISNKYSKRGFLTPTMAKKEHNTPVKADNALDLTRKQLHISTIPMSLPCREKEFSHIKSFLLKKIAHGAGGCMYISGVPGTGKTATVHAVIRSLIEEVDERELPDFDFVEVNGLRLSEPKQAYVRIYQALTDRKVSPDQAQQLLSKRFSVSCKKSTIILVDELDYLCNRRQDVVYNILDWPSRQESRLVVLTISNTLDLPERTLKGRVTSRLGLTRLVFTPYSHHQLREIVTARLIGSDTFHPDAVQLVARKVAAVSGDARRALDICRRTTELIQSGEQVTATHVERALTQIFSGPRVLVIQRLSRLSQLVLRSLRDENQRTGVDDATVAQVYRHLEQITVLEGLALPPVGAVLQSCVTLVGLGLVVAEKGRADINRKLSLNVSSDDIHYALDNARGH